MRYAENQPAVAESDTQGFPDNFHTKIAYARSKRQPSVLTWDWCRRMLKGEQNYYLDYKRNRMMQVPDSGNRRNQTVTDILLPPYRTGMALLRTQQPKLEFHGTSATWSELTKGLACNQAASAWWQQNQLNRLLRKGVRYMMTDGLGCLHNYYDPGKKKVCTNMVSAYDFLFEADVRSLDEAQWFARRHLYTRKDLAAAYPDKAAQINELPSITTLDNKSPVPEDRLDVWEIYWRDGSGRHAILCEQIYLWQGTSPGNRCQLYPLCFTQVPGEPWPIAMIAPLLDPQRRYNRYRNIQLDIADQHSNPVWLVNTASNVPKSAFNNNPDNVIAFSALGGAPTRAWPQNPPQGLFEQTAMALSETMDLAGFHPSTTGKRSVGVTSGVAIRELADGDMTQLDDVVQNINDAVMDCSVGALVLWKAYLTEEQLVRFMDESVGTVVFRQLRGTDLLDDPQVFMVPGTLFTIDAQNRDERLLGLYDKKIVDADQVKRQLSFRVDNMSSTKKMLALAHATDLLAWVRAGQQIEIFPTDDLQTIADVFKDFMGSPAYYEPLLKAHAATSLSGGNPLALGAYDRQREIMEYIRDIVVSIETFGQPVDAYLQASNTKVFPRTDPKPQQQIQATTAGPNSQGAQDQMLQQATDMRTRAGQMGQAQQSFEAIKGTPGISGARG